MRPFELIPPIKDYIWGGTRLRDEYGRKSGLKRLAESWELSCHRDGESIVADGEYAGKALSEFLGEHPEALGENCNNFEDFPILVKLIDARDNLSVQVHPDDEYARKYENDNGKTEMWYIVDCDEGAELIYGFKEEITKEVFRKAIEENTLLDYVNRVPVKKGDVFFIKPGTLHAIGKGILIAEIQQSSNVTYRVYDYGRVGDDGKPRELHLEKALDVTKLCPTPTYNPQKPVELDNVEVQILADCNYFTVSKQVIKTGTQLLADKSSFNHILAIDGEAVLTYECIEISLKKGSSVFVPAGTGAYEINGKATIIITEIKQLQEEN